VGASGVAKECGQGAAGTRTHRLGQLKKNTRKLRGHQAWFFGYGKQASGYGKQCEDESASRIQ
jgi:hypothetical protein